MFEKIFTQQFLSLARIGNKCLNIRAWALFGLGLLLTQALEAVPEGVEKLHTNPGACLKCHVNKSSGDLHLATGARIARQDVPVLCGQCHGVIKRDWDKNLHGKKTGGWKQGERLSCTECHHPHHPAIQPVTAKPPPPRPKLGIEKGSSRGE